MANITERSPGHFRILVSCGSDLTGRKHVETTTFVADPNLTPKQQRKAAEDYARRFEDEIHNAVSLDGRKMTLNDFAQKWMEEYAKVNLQPRTVEKYREELDGKILPALGRVKLLAINPAILNTFFVSLTKDGARKDGKRGGYAKSSIAKTKNVISCMMRCAVEWELLEKNPCSRVRVAAVPSTADNIKYFTPEQATAFLAHIEQPYKLKVRGHQRTDDTGKTYTVGEYEVEHQMPEQLVILFNLAIYGGFRKGELLALKFSDIDYENCVVRISKSGTTVDGEQVCKDPKTRNSARSVSIPKALVERISALRAVREEDKAYFGDAWEGQDWLFVSQYGRMMNYSTPYEALQDAIARYNEGKPEGEQLPIIPFHGLRHTSATLLISAHQDIATVSKRLGHAHASVTLDIYTHALEKNDRGASDALENLLKK